MAKLSNNRTHWMPFLDYVSPTGFLSVLLFVCLVYCVISRIRLFLKLRHIKGPAFAAWSDLWYFRTGTSGRAQEIMSDVLAKYGSIARIGPSMVVTCDEELLRKINTVRGNFSKGDWYKAFQFDGKYENVLSETDDEKHRQLRNVLSAGYAGKDNPELETDIDAVIWDLIHLIQTKYMSTPGNLQPFDWAKTAQFFALDVITCLSLGGKPFGYVSQDKDMYDYVSTMNSNFPIMNFMATMPFRSVWFRIQRIPTVQKLMLPSIKDRTGLGKIKGVAFEIVSQRFQAKEPMAARPDMIHSFMKNGLSEIEIADNSLLSLLAGSDTTATLLRMVILQVISNPKIYHRLQKECLDAEVAPDTIIPYNHATQLPYLTACLKESLRLYPPASGILPRIVPAGGTYHTSNDDHGNATTTYLPAGTEVCSFTMSLLQNTSIYGLDASLFRPERWTDDDVGPDRLQRMERPLELVFSHGRHKCLGERIARIEAWKLTFELMRRFQFSFVDALRPVRKMTNYGLWLQQGMWLRVEEREELDR